MTRIDGPTTGQVDRAGADVAALLAAQLGQTVEATALLASDTVSADDLGVIPRLWTERVDSRLLPTLALAFHAAAAGVRDQLRAVAVTATAVRLADVPPVPSALVEAYLQTARNRLARVGDLAWEAARAQLLEGMAAGESHRRLARRIHRATGLALPRARTIARTEARDALLAGALNQVRATGLTGTKTWVAVRSPRTRPTHRHAHGQKVDLAGYFEVGGWPLDRPHDETAPAGETVNCRCGLRFDLDTADLLLGPTPPRAPLDRKLLDLVWGAGILRQGVTYADLEALLGDLAPQSVTAAAEALHLPGRHNQQTHGHGGSGNVRQQIAAALPPKEAERVTLLHDLFEAQYGHGFGAVETPAAKKGSREVARMRGDTLIVNKRLLWDAPLKKAEGEGWLAPGTGRVEGLITHEFGHRFLHDPYVGQAEGVARHRAVSRATEAAFQAGAPAGLKVSRYGQTSFEEGQAELFAHYHWGGDQRAPWVIAWGEALHQELDYDATPLSEVYG